MTRDRIASALATWDHYVAECAQAGLTVDPHAMTAVLLTTRTVGMPARWEVVES